jgi:hypothetical protein
MRNNNQLSSELTRHIAIHTYRYLKFLIIAIIKAIRKELLVNYLAAESSEITVIISQSANLWVPTDRHYFPLGLEHFSGLLLQKI